jgi:p-aminobenzoyl-glutamate transporter AbgT
MITKAGVGTLMASMMPYSIAFFIGLDADE